MNKKIIIVALAFILMVAVGGGLGACRPQNHSMPTVSAAEYLELGEKYLLEMNYEQALVQFLSVIELEPMNPRGYTGAAAAHIGLGDADKAVEILRQGLERLPNEASIQTMLNELAEPPAQSETESPAPDMPLWELFTDEQRNMLDRLEQAAETFAYEAVYEIMTSDAFLELYSRPGLNQTEGSGERYKDTDNAQWALSYRGAGDGNDNNRDYWWYRTEFDKMRMSCQLWFHDDGLPRIAIRHMSILNGNENGPFTMVYYAPAWEALRRYEGSASEQLRSGTEVVTDMITGEIYVIQYDENGMCTNYLLDENGNAYVQSGNGESRRYLPIDHAMYAIMLY